MSDAKTQSRYKFSHASFLLYICQAKKKADYVNSALIENMEVSLNGTGN